jgi:hypothetical protein
MRRVSLTLVVLGMAGVLMALLAPSTVATHPRPQGASPLRVSLVPAYNECFSGSSEHALPGPVPSCRPPVQSSNYVTVGTPDANGAPARSIGFGRYSVVVGTPGPPSDSDINIDYEITDVRCKPATSACGSANTTGGPDYTGELFANATGQYTDHRNGPSGQLGGTEAGTTVVMPWTPNGVILSCSATADPTIGSTCEVHTTANAQSSGGFVVDGRRQWLEKLSLIEVWDGGADGIAWPEHGDLFATEGIFIP